MTNYNSITVPIDYKGKIKYINNDAKAKEMNILELPHDTSLLKSFNNLVSNVTIYKDEKEGGLKIQNTSISGKNETYIVIYDFSQSQSVLLSEVDQIKYYGLIGVGARFVVNVTTKKRNINLANLFGLGINAKKIN